MAKHLNRFSHSELKIIIILFNLLFGTLDSFTKEHSNKIENNQITKIIPANHDDIINTFPIYEFNDDVEGSFIKEFLGSITEIPYNESVIVIKNTEVDRPYYTQYPNHLPENSIFLWQTHWEADFVEQCKGVIVLPNKYFGLIFSDNEEWTNKIHLKKTDDTLKVFYGKSYTDGLLIQMTTSYDIWAILTVSQNGKVDPVMIYNILSPIQDFEDLNTKFNWIEDFYTKHNLPLGCGYYNQQQLDPMYQQYKKSIAPPDNLMPHSNNPGDEK